MSKGDVVFESQNQHYDYNNLFGLIAFILWGSLLGKTGWPRYALAASPELVRHVSAVSALCPLWPGLQISSAIRPL